MAETWPSSSPKHVSVIFPSVPWHDRYTSTLAQRRGSTVYTVRVKRQARSMPTSIARCRSSKTVRCRALPATVPRRSRPGSLGMSRVICDRFQSRTLPCTRKNSLPSASLLASLQFTARVQSICLYIHSSAHIWTAHAVEFRIRSPKAALARWIGKCATANKELPTCSTEACCRPISTAFAHPFRHSPATVTTLGSFIKNGPTPRT